MNRSVIRFISGSLILAFLPATVFGAAAQTFEVTATPFRVNHTLSAGAGAIYVLSAATEQRVAYSMDVTTAAGCAILVFVKGHDLGPASQYFATYSQLSCVQRYANTFPVDAADGTEFSVVIETTSPEDVNYSLEVKILTPVLPRWTAGVLIILTIGLIPPALWILVRRRADANVSRSETQPPEPPTRPLP